MPCFATPPSVGSWQCSRVSPAQGKRQTVPKGLPQRDPLWDFGANGRRKRAGRPEIRLPLLGKSVPGCVPREGTEGVSSRKPECGLTNIPVPISPSDFPPTGSHFNPTGRDFLALPRDFLVLLRNFLVLLRDFFMLLRDFLVLPRDFLVLLRNSCMPPRNFILTCSDFIMNLSDFIVARSVFMLHHINYCRAFKKFRNWHAGVM